MSDSLAIAASGLDVAGLRLAVSAANIANAESAGPLPTAGGAAAAFPPAYVPQRVDQVAVSGGGGAGPAATVEPVSPATTASYDPTAPYADANGLVAMPNVDLAGEAVNLLVAKYSFTANAEVMRVLAQTTRTLLDIKT